MKRWMWVAIIVVVVLGVGGGVYLLVADQMFSGIDLSQGVDFSDLARLAYGTVALADTEYATDEAQAEELLGVWEMAEILVSDDGTSDAELVAIARSIESVMTDGQLSAIDDLKLDTDSVLNLASGGRAMGNLDIDDLSEEQQSQIQEQLAAMGGRLPGLVGGEAVMGTEVETELTDEEQADLQRKRLDRQAVRSVITYLQGVLGIEPLMERPDGLTLDGGGMAFPFAPGGGGDGAGFGIGRGNAGGGGSAGG